MTGAGGFVGQWLVPGLLAAGHEVVGALYPRRDSAGLDFRDRPAQRYAGSRLDLRDQAAVNSAISTAPDAVIHLAALASGADARRDPGLAWEVNAAGTARLAEALGIARGRAGQ